MNIKIGQCSNCQAPLALDSQHPSLRPGNILKLKCFRCAAVTSVKVPAERINDPSAPDHQRQEAAAPQVGWIVVHDENTPEQTFPLRLGQNVIGRYSPDKPCEVMIKTNDTLMSRNHSLIDVKRRSETQLVFVISDIGSTNGTFINVARRLSRYDKVILADGDTIQLGRTKIVLKTAESTRNSSEATGKVRQQQYKKTVVITD